jgi:hypothetical protein
MKKVFAILAMAALASCGGSNESTEAKADTAAATIVDTAAAVAPAVVDSAAKKVDSAAKAVVDTLKKK